jgi:type IV secretory pathway VirB2 component (pilin)
MDNYQADRAVEKRSEDLLGRVPFAEAIADALVSWRENASLVVGLTGEWGTGKTSIKNFIVDALAPEEEPKRADIVQIAPWELSGTHDIEAHFFTAIERFLTRKNAPSEDRQIAHRWRVAAAALGIGEALTQPLAQPISTGVVAIGLATMGIGALAPERGGWLLLGAIIALLGHLLTASKTVAERVSAFFETRNSRVAKSTGEAEKGARGPASTAHASFGDRHRRNRSAFGRGDSSDLPVSESELRSSSDAVPLSVRSCSRSTST